MPEGSVMKAINASRLFKGTKLDCNCLRATRVHQGQIVGDVAQDIPCVGLVVSGEIDVYSVATDGREVLLSSLKTGDVFGICNLLAQNDIPTLLRAREDGVILLIPKDYLLSMMRNDFNLTMRYIALCNEKIQFLLGRIEELTMPTAHDKLLDYLRIHADKKGHVTFNGSRDELANYLGISRTALFREIAALKHSGELSTEGHDLILRLHTA